MDDNVNFDAAFSQPAGRTDARLRIENNACRQALRLRGISPAAVAKHAGLDVRAPLTFRAVHESTGFWATPSVTDTPVDPFDQLTTRFERTNLWSAWVAAWDERPEVHPDDRMLVCESLGWGRVVLHSDITSVETRPGLVLHAGRQRLVLEVFRSWADSVWTASDQDTR